MQKQLRRVCSIHVRRGRLCESLRFIFRLCQSNKRLRRCWGWYSERAIEQQKRLIALPTELKKALLHKLFTEGLRGEPQKQTEIGPVPESWNIVELGKLATKISKGSSPRWQGFEYVPDGVLFVRSQNVGAGRMEFVDRVFVPPAFNEHERRSILKNENILI